MNAWFLLTVSVISMLFSHAPTTHKLNYPFSSRDIILVNQFLPVIDASKINALQLDAYNQMFKTQAPNLNAQVVDKILMTLKCANEFAVTNNDVLSIIDYSLPSNEKRLWVFDLKQNKLLFNTYVSHGIKSGALVSNYFSNTYNSKASSIGVYHTLKSYYGRDGLSLRLDGLDRNFNDNASNRAVVMHSGWYVEEEFIKKYGRPGRSWGCPALPLSNSQAIINTIKDHSLLVIYYPSDRWFAQSKFLNCEKMPSLQASLKKEFTLVPDDKREAILFVGNGYKNYQRSETKPVAVIKADHYSELFHAQVPLQRMLRRQINHQEYIALSPDELNVLALRNRNDFFKQINFVIPVLKMVHGGYYETQMVLVDLGIIKAIHSEAGMNRFVLNFEHKSPVSLDATNQFIRWVGL